MNGTRSPMNVRQLRIVQIVCLVLAVSARWLVAHSEQPKNNAKFGPIQWGDRFSGSVLCSIGFHISTLSQQSTASISDWWTKFHTLSVEYRTFDEARHCVLGCLVGGRHPYLQRALMDGLWVLRSRNSAGVGVGPGYSARRSSRNRLTKSRGRD